MDISLYTVYARSKSLPFDSISESFKYFSQRGVKYAEIVNSEFSELPLHRYCDILEEVGISPYSLVTTLDIASFSQEERENNIAAVKGFIDQMEKRNIPLMLISPGMKCAGSDDEVLKMRELALESIDKIINYAKGSIVEISIENQSSFAGCLSKVSDIRYVLDSLPELKFVLDTGNFFFVHEDLLECYELLKDRLVHMHCKDWRYDPYGFYVSENMPRFNGAVAGTGVLPLKELFKRLRGDGYDKNATIELNAIKISKEIIDSTIDFLQKEMN